MSLVSLISPPEKRNFCRVSKCPPHVRGPSTRVEMPSREHVYIAARFTRPPRNDYNRQRLSSRALAKLHSRDSLTIHHQRRVTAVELYPNSLGQPREAAKPSLNRSRSGFPQRGDTKGLQPSQLRTVLAPLHRHPYPGLTVARQKGLFYSDKQTQPTKVDKSAMPNSFKASQVCSTHLVWTRNFGRRCSLSSSGGKHSASGGRDFRSDAPLSSTTS